MYQILIVDDESIEREAVRFLLKQNNFPFEIHEATNGKEALLLLQNEQFDILFTDIRMPFLDGFELSRQARKLYPDIQIIFFTGYDEFSYIKEALSLRVINYILKPIDSAEFEKTITDVLEQLHVQERINEERKASLDTMRKHILYQLINGTCIRRLENLFSQLDFSFAYDCHRLLLIQLDREYFGSEFTQNDIDFFPIDLKHILPTNTYRINLNPSQNVILFTGQDHVLSWYQNMADKIIKQLRKEHLMNCYISISKSFSDPDAISHAYEEAEKQVMEQLFFTTTTIENMPASISADTQPETDDMILKQLRMDIQFKDSVSLKKHMITLIQSFKNKKSLSHIYFRFLSTNVLKLLLDGLSLNTEELVDKYAKIIYRSNHMSEIESLLLTLTDQLSDKLNQEHESPKYALQLVKQYIHNHYSEDLSLNILSKEVYLTPRYLSALFIEETGGGINKYIKKVRMEKAQKLLMNTNMKISDICQKVGYSNLSYFCKSFAEEFGATPDRFRNQKPSFTEEKK